MQYFYCVSTIHLFTGFRAISVKKTNARQAKTILPILDCRLPIFHTGNCCWKYIYIYYIYINIFYTVYIFYRKIAPPLRRLTSSSEWICMHNDGGVAWSYAIGTIPIIHSFCFAQNFYEGDEGKSGYY